MPQNPKIANTAINWYRLQLGKLDKKSIDFQILNYLIDSAIGYENAKPWKQIKLDLGLTCHKQAFQHGLLKISRENGFFIGASRKGYYLICNQNDAASAKAYYQERIEAEQFHLNKLNEMTSRFFV